MSCNRSIQSSYFYCLYLFNITGSQPELLWTICILFSISSAQKTCRNDCVTNTQTIELFFKPLYENEESWHPKRNVDLC